MECACKTGLPVNVDKWKIRCTQIPFFGHIVSASGLRPDPQKLDMINNMDPFTSLADLQPFLGMTQLLSHYVPNLASHSAALWDLTKGSSEFLWQPHHQLAVDKIKEAISSTNLLQYFGGRTPVTIQVDASLLAVVNGLEKFHYYAYGKQVTVETSHWRRFSRNISQQLLHVLQG